MLRIFSRAESQATSANYANSANSESPAKMPRVLTFSHVLHVLGSLCNVGMLKTLDAGLGLTYGYKRRLHIRGSLRDGVYPELSSVMDSAWNPQT